MPMTGAAPQPVALIDPLVQHAAERAFADFAARWHSSAAASAAERAALRAELLQAVIDLGFADALPAPDAREAWPTAAALLRAQACAAAPIDMALLLVMGDRDACIAYDPEAYPGTAPVVLPRDPGASLALALGRCLQISAALQAALALSLVYVQQRRQFGRAIAAFQAVQHGLAVAAEEVAAATVAADLALACCMRDGSSAIRLSALVDVAALVGGRAIDVGYDVFHQVHGAIGFTQEYALHRHSLDLLRWRDDLHQRLGGELRAAERLGDRTLAAGGVWAAVTALMREGASA